MNILFTNAGRRTYLIEYALELKKDGYDIQIFTCDTSEDTAAMHVSSEINTFLTPRVSSDEEAYFEILVQKCIAKNIKLIIPLMDYELPILAKNKTRLEQLGIKVWVSDYEVIINCLNKKKNIEFCMRNQIPVPRSYFYVDKATYPLVRKKIKGSGSVGMEVFHKKPEHLNFVEGEDMLQSFIEGTEIGMDVFNDYNGNYVHSCFREKLSMRSGETDKAKSFFTKELEKEAKLVSSIFRHTGNMDIDLIKTEDGRFFYIDFNPRFGGGYPFTHHSGANYLKFIFEDAFGIRGKIPKFNKSIIGMKGITLYTYE